jgi:integrase
MLPHGRRIIMADEPAIKVSGKLEARKSTNGKNNRKYWRIMLKWNDLSGELQRKSISTGILSEEKGKKTRNYELAEEMKKKAIEEWETILNYEKPIELVTESILFSSLMEEWLEFAKNDPENPIKRNTFGGYQSNVRATIAPYFREKGILLCDLTAEDINEFYDTLMKRPSKSTGKPLKASSIHKYQTNISRALQYAVAKGYIQYSVMDKVKCPPAKKYVGKFLRESEVINVCDTAKGHKLELGVILGAYYGLRRSEILGLRWESINLEAGYITIEHTITATSVDGKYEIIATDSTKSKSSYRSLPLIPVLKEKLLELQEEQELNRRLCGNCYNKDEGEYIYVDALGNRIKPNYISEQFPKFLEKHGLRRVRFHDLRHSCASLLLANGISLIEIRDWLGHSDIAITAKTYAHLDFQSKIKSANALTWIEKTSLAKEMSDVGETKQTINQQAVILAG